MRRAVVDAITAAADVAAGQALKAREPCAAYYESFSRPRCCAEPPAPGARRKSGPAGGCLQA